MSGKEKYHFEVRMLARMLANEHSEFSAFWGLKVGFSGVSPYTEGGPRGTLQKIRRSIPRLVFEKLPRESDGISLRFSYLIM